MRKRKITNYIIKADKHDPLNALGWFDDISHFENYISYWYEDHCLLSSYLFTQKELEPGKIAKMLHLYMED